MYILVVEVVQSLGVTDIVPPWWRIKRKTTLKIKWELALCRDLQGF